MPATDPQLSTDGEARELLRLAQQRFSNLIRSLPLGILIITGDGLIEAVNPAIVTLFGYQESELVGHSIGTVLSAPWTKDSSFPKWSESNLDATVELIGRSKQGDFMAVDLTITSLDSDRRGRLIASIQDVTERYLAQMQRREFYQMINHDIRAPLSAVYAFLETMDGTDRYGSLSDLGHERLLGALSNIDYIVTLVSDLLELDRLEKSKNRDCLNLQSVAASEMVEQAVTTMREVTDAKGIGIVSQIEEVVLVADCRRLVQVIVNLMTNAVIYSPSGETIELLVGQVGEMLQVSIRDHGPGVPDEQKALIFERFHRGSTRQAEGFGLGLAICRAIVKQHGGVISCEDASAGGTIFSFAVPINPLAASRGSSNSGPV